MDRAQGGGRPGAAAPRPSPRFHQQPGEAQRSDDRSGSSRGLPYVVATHGACDHCHFTPAERRDVLPQILTLVGTLVGAALGLSASLISSFFGRRDNDLRLQREIAAEIMTLFDDGREPAEVLTPPRERVPPQALPTGTAAPEHGSQGIVHERRGVCRGVAV